MMSIIGPSGLHGGANNLYNTKSIIKIDVLEMK